MSEDNRSEYDENENEEHEEYDDEDVVVNDYQDEDEGEKREEKKEDEDENEDDNLFDIVEEKEINFKKKISSSVKRVTKSNIVKISSYEYSLLYGKLTDKLIKSQIIVPVEMEQLSVVLDGDAFEISRFWIENRHIYKLPVKLSRELYGKTVENIDLYSVYVENELYFYDDESDIIESFDKNFRVESFNNPA